MGMISYRRQLSRLSLWHIKLKCKIVPFSLLMRYFLSHPSSKVEQTNQKRKSRNSFFSSLCIQRFFDDSFFRLTSTESRDGKYEQGTNLPDYALIVIRTRYLTRTHEAIKKIEIPIWKYSRDEILVERINGSCSYINCNMRYLSDLQGGGKRPKIGSQERRNKFT